MERTVQMVLDNNCDRLESSTRDPKLFNSVQHDPIRLLQLLQDKPLWEVLTPMQLHSELTVNTYLNYLRRVCPVGLRVFLREIGLPLCPDRYDYNGNQCAIVVANWEKLLQLLPTLEQVRAKNPELVEMFACVRAIPACLEGMQMIMTRTMSRRLHPEWREGFEKLDRAFSKFEPLYRKLVPASEKDPRVVRTPKIHVLVVYVRKWIEKHEQTTIPIQEGPFETFHDDYRGFEENFKIPRPPPGDDSDSEEEDENFEVETPACGTRSGAQKKRKAEREAEAQRQAKRKKDVESLLHIDTEKQEKHDARRTMTVQKRRLFSVAAHSTRQLFRFHDRLQQAADLYGKRKSKNRPLPWNVGYVKAKKNSNPTMVLRERDTNTK